MDHWDRRGDVDEAQGESLLRRELARQLAASIPFSNVSFCTLRRLLEVYPIGNEMTVHYTLMCPAVSRAGEVCMDSGFCSWFNKEFNIPDSCCFVVDETTPDVAITGTHTPALRLRRGCSRPLPTSTRRGFRRYYCHMHDPMDYDHLLQDCNGVGCDHDAPTMPSEVPPVPVRMAGSDTNASTCSSRGWVNGW